MSLLPKDTELQFPHQHVIPASAGSGKTYTLSHRYVQFLLSKRISSNNIRNILAITFTKLAAKEMKQRIVHILKQAALEEKRTLNQLSEFVSTSQQEIAHRSERFVDEIQKNYSDFNVRTIDSFLTTVFKASALELGVQPNIEIEFDSDTVIEQAFREYSQTLREGTPEAQFIDDLIGLIESNDFSTGGYLWNPFEKIVREVRQLQKTFGRYSKEPAVFDGKQEFEAIKINITEKATTLKNLLETTTLPVYSYYKNEIAKLADGDIFEVVMSGKKRYFNKYSDDAGAAKEIKKLFAAIRPLEKNLEQYLFLYSQMYYQPFVRAVTLVDQSIKNVKMLEGTVAMDDINRSLAKYLSNEIVPEVYLKLGERLSHFMIDEFQDTSPIQWHCLIPLIEEALSKQGSLFAVGDTKQSIYGFRGADWHIFKDLIDGKYFPSAPVTVIPLNENYRSSQVLVDFVKNVFSENVLRAGFEEHAKASGLYNFAQEVPESEKNKGYVEVKLIDKSVKDYAEDSHREYILCSIQDCIKRGYSLEDIAILTQTNPEVVEISSWLNKENIPFLSMSTLDIRKRKIIGEIIALLRFLDSPIDDLSFATFITGGIFNRNVYSISKNDIQSFLFASAQHSKESLYLSFRKKYQTEWGKYFDRLFSLVGFMPLYDIVSEVYKTFSIFERCNEEEGALIKFLECVKQFENSGKNSLKDFLSFSSEEESESWSISVPNNVHAVRIMTIHKSKGLGFPVVIVSLNEKKPRYNSMVTVETNEGIEVLRVGSKYGDRNEDLGKHYTKKDIEQTIDDLNKIYVALTRAMKEMYVLVLYKKLENLPAAILSEKLYGKKYAAAEKGKEEEKLPAIKSLYIHEHTPLPVSKYEKIGLQETHRGDIIHNILSNIEYIAQDIESTIDEALVKTSINSEFNLVQEKLNLFAFLSLNEVNPYFNSKEDRKVYREQDITSSEGRLYRMDRVVVDSDSVTVLDYKTGNDEKSEEYQEQVRKYMTMLKEVYPKKVVQGALLYIDLKKVVEVV